MNVPDWIGKFFENRGWLGLVQQDADNVLHVAGTPITHESYDYADFGTIDTTYRRYIIINDLHSANAASGAYGGSRWLVNPLASTQEEKIVLDSGPLWFDTYAAYLAAITPANHPGLEVRIGNIGKGLPVLVNKYSTALSTYRLVPLNGTAVFFSNTYGTLASPTITSGTAGTTWDFTSTLAIPGVGANLFRIGDVITVKGRIFKSGANGTVPTYITLGTGGTTADAKIMNVTIANTNPSMHNIFIESSIATATSMTTSSGNTYGGTGSSGGSTDISANFDTANAMTFSVGGTKTAGDNVGIGYLTILWTAQA